MAKNFPNNSAPRDYNSYDIFDNPMVEAARNAMTPEQIEEYKRIGEYMFNSCEYKTVNVGSQVSKSSDTDLINYATQALRSGLDPFDLTQEEVRALTNIYGKQWYTRFDYNEEEVPKLVVELSTIDDVKEEMERRANARNLSRSERRQEIREFEQLTKRAKKNIAQKK